MVGARRVIELTAAAAEMRYGVGHAACLREVGESLRIVAARRSLQPVEQDQQRPGIGGRRGARRGPLPGEAVFFGGLRREPVDVQEVAVGSGPALAAVCGALAEAAARIKRGPDRLQVAARQPPGRRVVQCSTCGLPETSCTSLRVPGLAWCATRRQPCGVL